MRLQHEGLLVSECTLAGETHADDVFAAHPNGLRVSRDRWLIIYTTRGMGGWDSDRSCVYQLRSNAPGGPVIKEGMLSSGIYDWDPLGNGKQCFKQHGHPTGFGVPKGAIIGGRPAAHANLFVIKWRVVGMGFDAHDGRIYSDPTLENSTQGAEWMQVRLNEAEDDIEVVASPAPMRQKGYELGEHYCPQALDTIWMNLAYVQPIPFKDDCTQWADCNHFSPFGAAAMKYVYNAALHRYEWVETGPYLFESGDNRCVFEASLIRWNDLWVIAGRLWDHGCAKGVAWLRTDDPFSRGGEHIIAKTPATNASRTAYTCADGILRLFTGDPSVSPYEDNADPLYSWDIDPNKDFEAFNRQVVFDTHKAGLERGRPRIDMCKLLPPQGNTQTIIYRVAPRPPIEATNEQTDQPLTEFSSKEKQCFGIYHSKLVYDEEIDETWRFA